MQKILKAATIIWAGIIFLFSLYIIPLNIPWDPSGIVLHFSAYVILAFLAMHAYDHKKHLWPIVIIAITFGIGIEILQSFVGRTMAISDVIANTIGVITAAVIIQNIEKISKTK